MNRFAVLLLLSCIACGARRDCAASDPVKAERRIADSAWSITEKHAGELDRPIRLFVHRTLARSSLHDANPKQTLETSKVIEQLESKLDKAVRRELLVGKSIESVVLFVEAPRPVFIDGGVLRRTQTTSYMLCSSDILDDDAFVSSAPDVDKLLTRLDKRFVSNEDVTLVKHTFVTSSVFLPVEMRGEASERIWKFLVAKQPMSAWLVMRVGHSVENTSPDDEFRPGTVAEITVRFKHDGSEWTCAEGDRIPSAMD